MQTIGLLVKPVIKLENKNTIENPKAEQPKENVVKPKGNGKAGNKTKELKPDGE